MADEQGAIPEGRALGHDEVPTFEQAIRWLAKFEHQDEVSSSTPRKIAFELAGIHSLLLATPAADRLTDTGEGSYAAREDSGALPWAYGWFDDGGNKQVVPHLPTVKTLRGVSSEAFPLYRHPATHKTADAGAMRLDFDKVSSKITSILADDPACNGRVSTGSIARIATLVVQAENYAVRNLPVAGEPL